MMNSLLFISAVFATKLEKPRLLEKVFRFYVFKVFKVFIFYVLMYEERTLNYDPEIHEYLIHDTPFLLPHHV